MEQDKYDKYDRKLTEKDCLKTIALLKERESYKAVSMNEVYIGKSEEEIRAMHKGGDIAVIPVGELLFSKNKTTHLLEITLSTGILIIELNKEKKCTNAVVFNDEEKEAHTTM